jgi:cytochrome c peroxidase
MRLVVWIAVAALTLAATAHAQKPGEPAQVAIGRRLFLETRFAQFFAANSPADVNAPLAVGDPTVATSETPTGPLPGPFAGQSINCRSCHLVREQLGVTGGGMRSYDDFAVRSPIPDRGDGRTHTVRNSPPLPNAVLGRSEGRLFHLDGEFATLVELTRSTLTGRNFGWLPREQKQATAHIARVIREDDGTGELAQSTGGAYATLLAGTDPGIPEALRLPPELRIDVARAHDSTVVLAVAKLIAAYVGQLDFSRDSQGLFNGSPYDAFLVANGLPRAPEPGELPLAYARRLAQLLDALSAPVFIDPNEHSYQFHDHPFAFGPKELEGLQFFLRESSTISSPHGAGNCVACHPPPNFTDFGFHNTGVSQLEYESGSFGFPRYFPNLDFPKLARRNRHPNDFLPPTPRHPNASGRYRSAPSTDDAGLTDLGLWNVLFNGDFPKPQAELKRALLASLLASGTPVGKLSKGELLDAAVARFKTPSLRDLGDSGPYMHNGLVATIDDVPHFYDSASTLERGGVLWNGDVALKATGFGTLDYEPLAAFLRSLDEDYQ